MKLPLYTGDIDFALIDAPPKSAREIAETVATALGYLPKVGFITNHRGELISQVALVVGREPDESKYSGIDFLLPVMEWIEPAVQRAQHNKLDYGFAQIASLTPEDLIVAKLFALQGTPERKHDLDDILSIIKNLPNLNYALIRTLVQSYNLTLPVAVSSLMKS